MDERKFYVTTAIDYVNGVPHLGHAYEKTGTDALARFHRQRGRDVFFLTGTDENATRNEQVAREQGISARALVDRNAAAFKRLCDTWNISYDRFIRTSVDEDHRRGVQEFVRRWIANGDIYLGTYEGLYCAGCEAFYEENDLVNGECELHPSLDIQRLSEENYFFRLSKYQPALERLYREQPEFCVPAFRRNEVLGWLARGLRDISVSRRGLTWGIPFPEHADHTVYVWFDALINYVTGVGFGTDEARFAKWWPADLHVIGKDISRFHCVYWPAMLLAAGVPLPRQVFVHGFLENTSGRLSKSSGNVVEPIAFAEEYGVDAARYLLLREAAFERDSPISAEQFNARFNAELANGLGNTLQRTLAMIEKYRGSRVPDDADLGSSGSRVREAAERALEDHEHAAEQLRFSEAIGAVVELLSTVDRHYQETKPWSLAKSEDQAHALDAVLYAGAEAVRLAAVLLWPYVPGVAARIAEQLGQPAPGPSTFAEQGRWGVLRPGTRITLGAPLFPRLELARAG